MATGRDFPDALSGSAAAGAKGSPILLVDTRTVPSPTLAELKRLQPKKITLLGGTAAVSAAVATQLQSVAPVTRIAGADRYATSAAVSKATFTTAPRLLLATGTTFADVLVGRRRCGQHPRSGTALAAGLPVARHRHRGDPVGGIPSDAHRRGGCAQRQGRHARPVRAADGKAAIDRRRQPCSGGFPDASSTGPAAAGYTLTAYSGSRSISTAGTVISGKKIVGDLDIYAANVTIKGCDITGTVTIHGVGGTQVLDSAIHGASATDTSQGDGIHTAGAVSTLTVKRTNIYWTYNDYLELSTGAFDIEDNYLHDAVRPAANPPHFDGISVWDGPSSGTKIIHNTILIGFDQSTTGILGFAHDNGSANQLYANVTISNNLLGGTGYILYPPGPVSQNVTFTNNQITTRYFPNGGSNGVVYKPQQPSWGTNGNTWSGNTWADGPKAGTTVSPTN